MEGAGIKMVECESGWMDAECWMLDVGCRREIEMNIAVKAL